MTARELEDQNRRLRVIIERLAGEIVERLKAKRNTNS
jgi:hypothetical protein